MSDNEKPRRGRPPGTLRRNQREGRQVIEQMEERVRARRMREARRGQRLPDTEMSDEQAAAHGWVRQGVRRISVALMPRDCIVLMAASHEATGEVGVAAEVRCEAMVALTALGKLVGEVNEAFMRDGVKVRARLSMLEVSEDGPRATAPPAEPST